MKRARGISLGIVHRHVGDRTSIGSACCGSRIGLLESLGYLRKIKKREKMVRHGRRKRKRKKENSSNKVFLFIFFYFFFGFFAFFFIIQKIPLDKWFRYFKKKKEKQKRERERERERKIRTKETWRRKRTAKKRIKGDMAQKDTFPNSPHTRV